MHHPRPVAGHHPRMADDAHARRGFRLERQSRSCNPAAHPQIGLDAPGPISAQRRMGKRKPDGQELQLAPRSTLRHRRRHTGMVCPGTHTHSCAWLARGGNGVGVRKFHGFACAGIRHSHLQCLHQQTPQINIDSTPRILKTMHGRHRSKFARSVAKMPHFTKLSMLQPNNARLHALHGRSAWHRRGNGVESRQNSAPPTWGGIFRAPMGVGLSIHYDPRTPIGCNHDARRIQRPPPDAVECPLAIPGAAAR